MTGERYGQLTFPALLRGARQTYGSAITAALSGAGFDDVPRNGAYVIGGIAGTGAALGEIITRLGVSKQAAGQLVDTLVVRGYLARAVDPEDRRRLTVTLTSRGQAAAQVIRAAVVRIDADLLRRVGPESVAGARTVLAALMAAGDGERQREEPTP